MNTGVPTGSSPSNMLPAKTTEATTLFQAVAAFWEAG